jgi:predicted Zn-dependent protease
MHYKVGPLIDVASFRRLCGFFFLVAVSVLTPCEQAYALSTSGEITQARRADREVVTEQGVIDNPLLSAWVNRVAAADWRFVGRKDVPYSVKILDEGDVNAFTIGGGFIYINAGALDFVASDDELAGVIGHETGHNEHRHPITLRQRGEILSILFGLAAIFAPVSIGLGSFAQEGMMAHASRTDEYQADQYGLMVMSRAGYDPDAMVSFMQRLGRMTGDEQVDAYLADHPGVPERIKRLRGYRELQSNARTPQKRLSDAQHDQNDARYSVAMAQYENVTKQLPHSGAAWLGLGETQSAMGFPERARRSFAQAAEYGGSAERTAAAAAVRALPFATFWAAPTPAQIAVARKAIIQRRAQLREASEALSAEIASDKVRSASIQARLTALSNDTEELAGIRDDGKSESGLPHTLEKLGRAINAVTARAATVVNGVGTLTLGREGGELNDASELMQEMGNLVASDTPIDPGGTRMRDLPHMLASVAQAQRELQSSVEASTLSLQQLNRGLDQFEVFLQTAKSAHNEFGSELDLKSNARLRSEAERTHALLEPALASSRDAEEAYDRARAEILVDHIALLGVDASPVSELAFRHAVQLRCGVAPPSQQLVAKERLTAGEVAAATILAAEKRVSADEIVLRARARNEALITSAPAARGDALALEIFLGLIYLDYTDELPKQG